MLPLFRTNCPNIATNLLFQGPGTALCQPHDRLRQHHHHRRRGHAHRRHMRVAVGHVDRVHGAQHNTDSRSYYRNHVGLREVLQEKGVTIKSWLACCVSLCLHDYSVIACSEVTKRYMICETNKASACHYKSEKVGNSHCRM